MSEEQKKQPQINSKDIAQKYSDTVQQYIQNTSNQTYNKLFSIQQMNDISLHHYKNNQVKLGQIEQELKQQNLNFEKLEQYFQKIDNVGITIDGMESSVEYLEVVLNRIEQKLKEAEAMYK